MVLLLFCNVHIKIRNKQNNLVSKKKVERIVQSKAGFVDIFFFFTFLVDEFVNDACPS